jgi:hypothetical protein
MKIIYKNQAKILFYIILILIALILNFLLLVNPGYYSHDELGFGFYSQGYGDRSLSDIDWFSFFNIQAPQYRPITFNTWLFISHFLFQYPPLFHLVVVLLGLACGLALYHLILQISNNRIFAITSFLIFSILPSTSFTIAWVGTIGDFIWVFCSISMLSIAYKFIDYPNITRQILLNHIAIAIIFIIALMSKETAIIIPGIFFLYFILIKRSKFVFRSFLILSFISVIYLCLRFDALFGTGHSKAYSVTPNAALRNLIGYWVYPFAWQDFLGYPTDIKSLYFIFCFVAHFLICFFLWRTETKYAKVYPIAYIFTLAPILVIPMWSPHYLFASSILMSAALAFLLTHGKRISKSLIVIFTLILIVHSFNIQLEHYNRGVIQNRIFNSLYVQIKNYLNKSNSQEVLKVYIVPQSDAPSLDILQRAINYDVHNINDLNIKDSITIGIPLELEESQNKLVLQFVKGGYITELQWPKLYSFGQEISFLKDGNGTDYIAQGWSTPEPEGTWTDGNKAGIILKLAEPVKNDLKLVANFSAFVNDRHQKLTVDVLANNNNVATWTIFYNSDRTTQKVVKIPMSLLSDDSLLKIDFQIRNPTSPGELGINGDFRQLGLRLSSISLTQ